MWYECRNEGILHVAGTPTFLLFLRAKQATWVVMAYHYLRSQTQLR